VFDFRMARKIVDAYLDPLGVEERESFREGPSVPNEGMERSRSVDKLE